MDTYNRATPRYIHRSVGIALAAIADYVVERGYSPNYREIRDMGGFSSISVANYSLRKLEAAGLLRFQDGLARTIVLTDEGWRTAGYSAPVPAARVDSGHA